MFELEKVRRCGKIPWRWRKKPFIF